MTLWLGVMALLVIGAWIISYNVGTPLWGILQALERIEKRLTDLQTTTESIDTGISLLTSEVESAHRLFRPIR